MSRRRSALLATIKPTDLILKEAHRSRIYRDRHIKYAARAPSGARAPQDDVRSSRTRLIDASI
jgi:hypothetical protein